MEGRVWILLKLVRRPRLQPLAVHMKIGAMARVARFNRIRDSYGFFEGLQDPYAQSWGGNIWFSTMHP
jgi:hypothetical protein